MTQVMTNSLTCSTPSVAIVIATPTAEEIAPSIDTSETMTTIAPVGATAREIVGGRGKEIAQGIEGDDEVERETIGTGEMIPVTATAGDEMILLTRGGGLEETEAGTGIV